MLVSKLCAFRPISVQIGLGSPGRSQAQFLDKKDAFKTVTLHKEYQTIKKLKIRHLTSLALAICKLSINCFPTTGYALSDLCLRRAELSCLVFV